MKSNRTKYILLLLVVSIWGLVVYKYLRYRGEGGAPTQKQIDSFDLSQSLSDTFSLKMDYADPFRHHDVEMSEGTSLPQNSKKTLVKKKVKEEQKAPIRIWPNIHCKGLVINENQHNNRVIIIINNVMYVLKKGDEIQGVRVISICKDSISLKMSNQQKFFKIYEN